MRMDSLSTHAPPLRGFLWPEGLLCISSHRLICTRVHAGYTRCTRADPSGSYRAPGNAGGCVARAAAARIPGGKQTTIWKNWGHTSWPPPPFPYGRNSGLIRLKRGEVVGRGRKRKRHSAAAATPQVQVCICCQLATVQDAVTV